MYNVFHDFYSAERHFDICLLHTLTHASFSYVGMRTSSVVGQQLNRLEHKLASE